MAHVLIVDDDADICDAIATTVRRMGHEPATASSIAECDSLLLSRAFDLAFVDVRLPDGDGLELLPRIRENTNNAEVVVITGFGDPDGAETALRNGAWSYIEKPFSIRKLRSEITRALEFMNEKDSRPPTSFDRGPITGNSPAILSALGIMARAADTDVNVHLMGETGTGKELFALAVHNNSKRSRARFVVVDCAALPDKLVEGVLFGHVKGAFTGADRDHQGLISQANGGTLFLDEVAELPMEAQKKFLRVLQEKRFRPVGGKAEISSNFRLISATNKELEKLVKEGRFREDLLFRLKAIPIVLPPLRDRKDDIALLAKRHLASCSPTDGPPRELADDFIEVLKSHDWPGNVRELHQAIDHALASAGNTATLFSKDLPLSLRIRVTKKSLTDTTCDDTLPVLSVQLPEDLPPWRQMRDLVLEDLEEQYLRQLLSQTNGNAKESCRISGLSRSRFYALLKKYDIRAPRSRLT